MNEHVSDQLDQELERTGAAMIRVATALGTAAIVIMALVDPFLASGDDLYWSRVVRLTSSIALMALYAATHLSTWKGSYARVAAIASAVTTGGAVIVLAYFTGGGDSDYHEALYLTIFGYAVLPIPWKRWDNVAIYVGLILFYDGLLLVGGRPGALGSLPTHNALLGLGTFIAVILQGIIRRSRLNELAQRAELASANERLTALDEAKTRFFANLSHELRTPLTLTLAPLDALLESSREPLSDGQREKLALAQRNALRLLRQVDDLLALTRAEAASLKLQVSDVDLVATLRELSGDIAELARRKRITLELNAEDGLPSVKADAQLVERVLLNVIGNAAKFVKEGGRIVLGARLVDGGIDLTVEDNGIGISATDLPRIFDRFYQADSGTKRAFGGTGIGLALAREICELHGGRIRAESELNVGTTIHCWFPLSLPPFAAKLSMAAPQRTDPGDGGLPEWHDAIRSAASYRLQGIADATERRIAPRPQPKGQVPTILVVEDNPDMIRFISALLGHDYNVRSATDGEQGLRYATEHRPDLIISDVMMPVMDGLEMGRELRKSPATASIPLIYLTARGAPDDRVQGMGSGADTYLAKPFRNEELLASVESLLSRQRRVREAAVLRQDEAIVYMASGVAESLDAAVATLGSARDALADSPKLAAPLDTALVPLRDLAATLTEFTRAGVKHVDAPADVADVIARVVATTLGQRPSGVEVHQAIEAGLRVGVLGDELERVLLAVIGRAVRTTPSGRNVFVSAHPGTTGCVAITVSDQGPTLSPTQLERVFFPFNEVPPTGPGGVRAGMALTHAGRLISARGGALSVEVGTTGGTTVSIRLPVWTESSS